MSSQYKKYAWDFASFQVFGIWGVFYIYSTSLFGFEWATLQVFGSLMLLLHWTVQISTLNINMDKNVEDKQGFCS